MLLCLTDINPAEITEENIPSILGAIVVELKALNKKVDGKLSSIEKKVDIRFGAIDQRLNNIDGILAEHERLLWGPLKLTKEGIFPLLWKNKLTLILIWFLLSLWISAIDWLVRGAQWAYLPPVKLP